MQCSNIPNVLFCLFLSFSIISNINLVNSFIIQFLPTLNLVNTLSQNEIIFHFPYDCYILLKCPQLFPSAVLWVTNYWFPGRWSGHQVNIKLPLSSYWSFQAEDSVVTEQIKPRLRTAALPIRVLAGPTTALLPTTSSLCTCKSGRRWPKYVCPCHHHGRPTMGVSDRPNTPATALQLPFK